MNQQIIKELPTRNVYYIGILAPYTHTCDAPGIICVTKTVTKQNKPLIISGLLWSIGESNS